MSGQKANEDDAKDILIAARALVHYNSLLFHRLTEEEWSKTGINFKGEPVAIRYLGFLYRACSSSFGTNSPD